MCCSEQGAILQAHYCSWPCWVWPWWAFKRRLHVSERSSSFSVELLRSCAYLLRLLPPTFSKQKYAFVRDPWSGCFINQFIDYLHCNQFWGFKCGWPWGPGDYCRDCNRDDLVEVWRKCFNLLGTELAQVRHLADSDYRLRFSSGQMRHPSTFGPLIVCLCSFLRMLPSGRCTHKNPGTISTNSHVPAGYQ